MLVLTVSAWLASVVPAAIGPAGAAEPLAAEPLAAEPMAAASSIRAALYSPRPVPAGGVFVPAQLPACYPPGARICVNGWVWRCRCYSFGCHWTTGSRRC
jgi:hypothetical protein